MPGAWSIGSRFHGTEVTTLWSRKPNPRLELHAETGEQEGRSIAPRSQWNAEGAKSARRERFSSRSSCSSSSDIDSASGNDYSFSGRCARQLKSAQLKVFLLQGIGSGSSLLQLTAGSPLFRLQPP